MNMTEKRMRQESDMLAELARLRGWKEEATTVIHAWEAVGAALEVDKIGTLGESKAAIALREVVRLREVNVELLAALAKMHYFVEMTAYRLRDALPGETVNESTIVHQDRTFAVDVVKDADRLLAITKVKNQGHE